MKIWKEASSVIIASKAKCRNGIENTFSIFTLKRHSNNSILPNYYVFPGGHVDKSDSHVEWQKIFAQTKCKNFIDSLNSLNHNVTLKIFQNTPEDVIPKAVSLRIAAIRETFEESGILICKRYEDQSRSVDQHLEIDSLCQWRQKVLSDPSNFIQLCQENKCYPNIMALNLWSNWITPYTVLSRKFNAVFFLVVLDQCYSSIPDLTEISEVGWHSPVELLRRSQEGNVSLSFPQFYELSRLLRFNDVSQLSQFAKEVNKTDCEAMQPVVCFTDNETISLLPGDEFYPENPAEFTLEQGRKLKDRIHKCNKYHRFSISHADADSGDKKNLIVKNVFSKYAHILPYSSDDNMAKYYPKNKC